MRPATFCSSTRLAPLVMTSTARWLCAPRNTSDFAIWSTRQSTARAASADVRADCCSITTVWPPPAAASASRTRCTLAFSIIEKLASLDGPRRAGDVGRIRPHLIVVGHREKSEEHTSELQSQFHLVCRLLLEKKKTSC